MGQLLGVGSSVWVLREGFQGWGICSETANQPGEDVVKNPRWEDLVTGSCSLHKYLLNTCSVPGTVLRARNIAVDTRPLVKVGKGNGGLCGVCDRR